MGPDEGKILGIIFAKIAIIIYIIYVYTKKDKK